VGHDPAATQRLSHASRTCFTTRKARKYPRADSAQVRSEEMILRWWIEVDIELAVGNEVRNEVGV